MLFECEVGRERRSHQIWSKALGALASVADYIKFDIAENALTLSAINSAKTAHAAITFGHDFFERYQVVFPSNPMAGYNSDTSSMSFLVISAHLATLFKYADSHEYMRLKINWTNESAHRLLVEVKLTKLIVKKYQTSYRPVVSRGADVRAIYKSEFRRQSRLSAVLDVDKIRFLVLPQPAVRRFLDTVPQAAEDFRLEVSGGKLQLTGYTREIVKDRDYLKQPMAVLVAMPTDDLRVCDVHGTGGASKLCINFRLRDFRQFVELSLFELPISREEYAPLDDEKEIDVWFRQGGDPAVFEMRTPLITIHYTHVFSDEAGEVGGTTYALPQYKPVARAAEDEGASNPKRRRAEASKTPEPTLLGDEETQITPEGLPDPSSSSGDDPIGYTQHLGPTQAAEEDGNVRLAKSIFDF